MLGAFALPLGAGSSPANAVSASARGIGGTLLVASDADGDTDVYAVPARGGRARALTRNHDPDEPSSLDATVLRRWRGTVYVLRADGRWRRVGGPYVYGSPALTARGRRVVFLRGDKLIVASADGRRVWRLPLRGSELEVSSDGRNVAFIVSEDDKGKPGVLVTSVETGKTRRVASGSGFDTAWSPDGSLLLLRRQRAGATNAYLVADVRSPRPARLLARVDSGLPAWSPGGRWLAFGHSVRGGNLVTVVNTRSARRWTTRAAGSLEALASSPRGTRFAFLTSRAGRYRLVVVNPARRIARTVAQARSLADPIWSPDDRRIALVGRRSETDAALLLASASGGRTRTLVRGRSVVPIAWHPESRRLVFAAGQAVGVVDVHGRVRGKSRATFRAPSEVVWSPGGDAFAFTAGYGGESVYVARADGRRLARLTHRGTDRILAWLPSRTPRRSFRTSRVPSTERPAPRTLDTRGRVVAVSSEGAAVGVLVAPHELDCIHAVIWQPGRSLLRIGTPAPCPESDEDQPLDVKLTAKSIRWSQYSCGNNCYIDTYRAARAATDYVTSIGGDDVTEGQPVPPLPPVETHRGVSILVNRGVVRLQRIADGAERTISAPRARIFDAELEDEGLFYAFNRPRGEFLGRVVFVPFDELFAS